MIKPNKLLAVILIPYNTHLLFEYYSSGVFTSDNAHTATPTNTSTANAVNKNLAIIYD